MTRHGKNSTASSVYSYAERRKDARQSGYGALKERLGADSVKPFDCCCLTLQACKNPMITPDGYIFDKEAILQYIVDQKKEIKKRSDAFDKFAKIEDEKQKERDNEAFEDKKRKFMALETTPAHIFSYDYQPKKRKADTEPGPSSKKEKADEEESLSNMAGDKKKVWKSFWVPQVADSTCPDQAKKVEKPNEKVLNPVSGKPIKFKDLLPVIFTPIDEKAASSNELFGMKDRYKCPITGDVLTNSSKAVYIKTSKRIVSSDCLEKIIKKDMVDPLTNKKITEDDIIELQRGGTGFAATNKTEAKVNRPQMSGF